MTEPQEARYHVDAPTDLISTTPYLTHTDIAVSLSDPNISDNPLIWVNDAFVALTGYAAQLCVGRNCRFLQGPMTRRTDAARIATTLANNRVDRTDILNYRASGQPFHNAVYVGPVRAANGSVRQHFGLQWDVTTSERRAGAHPDSTLTISAYRERLAERRSLSLRLRDVVVKRSSLLGGDALGYALIERLACTVRPEQYPIEGDIVGHTLVRGLLEFILAPYSAIYTLNINLEGADVEMSPDVASVLALVLHELIMQTPTARVGPSATTDIDLRWKECGSVYPAIVEIQWIEPLDTSPDAAAQRSAQAPDMAYVLMGDALACIDGTLEEVRHSGTRCLKIRVPRDRLPAP